MTDLLKYIFIIYAIVKLFEFVIVRYFDRKNKQYENEAAELQKQIDEKEKQLKQSPLPYYHIQTYRPTTIKEVQKITDISHALICKGGDGKQN
jgi:C4-dicarboxylate transporter